MGRLMKRRIVLFFCVDEAIDPVASRVLRELEALLDLSDGEVGLDGFPLRHGLDAAENELVCVRTKDVFSRSYERYLPELKRLGKFDWAVIVNWHEGMKAPDQIFTVHTTGDIESGVFPRSDPLLVRQLMTGLEQARRAEGLADFQVLTEGTHWSGVQFGSNGALCGEFPVPIVDLEVGSTPNAWNQEKPIRVLARTITSAFARPNEEVAAVICVGGAHIDGSYVDAALDVSAARGIAIVHLLPNHWLVSGGYDSETGLERLRAAAESSALPIAALVVHAKLAGPYKKQVRTLAEQLGVPCLKHRALRDPAAVAGLFRSGGT